MPRNVVVVLLDSLNRHLLGSYGSTEFATPNLDVFAARSVRFTQHVAGSLPCIPARHDLLCGAMDFLWKPWGSIELWEEPLTRPLHRAGVVTQLVSDHPHLFETGGENYHTDFAGWDYQRGHESDPWKTVPDPSWVGTPELFHRSLPPYHLSRGWFRDEDDFPGPRTMQAVVDWLGHNAGPTADGRVHDRFFLFVDEFDPHEPFDTPEPYASMYDPDWDDAPLIWPPYARGAIAKGVITERQGRNIRANYGAKLTMIDRWFGELLAAFDRHDLWSDTAIVVCTDHGHYLGEKDLWGKPAVPLYATLVHTPLFIAWPGVEARTCDALSTNVDLHATVCDVFGVRSPHRQHGTSLVPLVTGEADHVREWALAGVWGREVHLLTDRYTYARSPRSAENLPLSMWSNRWSTMPVHAPIDVPFPMPDDRAVLDRMPGSTVPVIRQPFQPGDLLPFWAYGWARHDYLWDHHEDPAEDVNLAPPDHDQPQSALADDLEALLVEALRSVDAPEEHLTRLGLS